MYFCVNLKYAHKQEKQLTGKNIKEIIPPHLLFFYIAINSNLRENICSRSIVFLTKIRLRVKHTRIYLVLFYNLKN